MKIALAQIASKKGAVTVNLAHHLKVAQLAAKHQADLLVFPELSITGYEPTLGKKLALASDDPIFDELQKCSDANELTIGIGIPLQDQSSAHIALLLLHPKQARQVYIKQYLHTDERPFFVSGQNKQIFINTTKIALAICYELSVEAHTKTAVEQGAAMYLASVAKTADGVKKSYERLAQVAHANNFPTLMVNSVGPNDDFVSAGQSAIWNADGQLVGALKETQEGLLIFDTKSNSTEKHWW